MKNEITLALLLLTIGTLAGADVAELALRDDTRGLVIGLAGACIYKLRLNKDAA